MQKPEGAATEYCFAWFAPRASDGGDRAAALERALWPSGAIITVSFLDGDETLQQRVMEAAALWTGPGLANVIFARRKTGSKTDIRISFKYKGSWSLIGTDCKSQKDQTVPTMNFGWLTPQSNDVQIRSVVLHEFGHALGLIHEHQSPAGGIRWNREQVYEDLSGPPYNWSPQMIQTNVFDAFEASETNFSELDPKSIMMYPYPAKWTLNGFSTTRNNELSEIDKEYIHELYP